MRFSLVIATLVATVLPIWAGEFTSKLTVTGDWTGRMEAHFTFPLTEDLIGWEATVTFSDPVDGMNPMAGQVYKSSSDKKTWTLTNKPDKPYEAKGSFDLMFYGDYSGSSAPSGTAVLKNMGVDDYTVKATPFSGNLKYNYADVLHKSILFYEAQRSGKLPDDNRIPWRGDSALDDKGDKGEDLTGGWYDAGDHIKFNFPMAYATTVLAWSYIEWEDAYKDAGEADWLLDCIKWPLDYLLKCHTGQNELYVQVGDAGPDHSYWGAPETMTMARPAYKVTASAPGSDAVFETAAAMAAGSMAFKSKDPSYAATLLDHAKELWEFGHAHQGKYSDSVQAAAGFYRSENYTDETCWGSNWLYRATGDQKYLDEAEKQFDPDPAWGQSWDEKTIGNQVLLYLNTKKDKYKQAVINTYKGWFPEVVKLNTHPRVWPSDSSGDLSDTPPIWPWQHCTLQT